MRIIRGKFGHRRFTVPSNISARPTTDFARENLFNVLENLVDFEGEQPMALDLFAGTGAISFELLSRGCSHVTSVEKASMQVGFIRKVASELKVGDTHNLVRGDVFKFIATCRQSYDIVFADPPYDLPRFGEIPGLVLGSSLLSAGSLFIIEHSRNYDFSELPHFFDHRVYGSVNFSIFKIPSETNVCSVSDWE